MAKHIKLNPAAAKQIRTVDDTVDGLKVKLRMNGFGKDDALYIGVRFADRADMWELIDRRVDAMEDEGLLEEVQTLLQSGLPRDATALQAIGYKEFLGVLEGERTVADALAEVKLRSRQYAKRQLTWLRRNKEIFWIDWEKERDFDRALRLSTEFLSANGLR